MAQAIWGFAIGLGIIALLDVWEAVARSRASKAMALNALFVGGLIIFRVLQMRNVRPLVFVLVFACLIFAQGLTLGLLG